MEDSLEAVCTVDLSRLIQALIDAGECCDVDDRTEADALPQVRYDVYWPPVTWICQQVIVVTGDGADNRGDCAV